VRVRKTERDAAQQRDDCARDKKECCEGFVCVFDREREKRERERERECASKGASRERAERDRESERGRESVRQRERDIFTARVHSFLLSMRICTGLDFCLGADEMDLIHPLPFQSPTHTQCLVSTSVFAPNARMCGARARPTRRDTSRRSKHAKRYAARRYRYHIINAKVMNGNGKSRSNCF
jgi:hypothetical protein